MFYYNEYLCKKDTNVIFFRMLYFLEIYKTTK